jgi:hypothetical protein
MQTGKDLWNNYIKTTPKVRARNQEEKCPAAG